MTDDIIEKYKFDKISFNNYYSQKRQHKAD